MELSKIGIARGCIVTVAWDKVEIKTGPSGKYNFSYTLNDTLNFSQSFSGVKGRKGQPTKFDPPIKLVGNTFVTNIAEDQEIPLTFSVTAKITPLGDAPKEVVATGSLETTLHCPKKGDKDISQTFDRIFATTRSGVNISYIFTVTISAPM